MKCTVPHTQYQPTGEEWKCPVCGADANAGFTIFSQADGVPLGCELLHNDDDVLCMACDHSWSGKGIAEVIRKPESVYERARKAHVEAWCIEEAIDAGEAAEKRAEAAERERDEALALLKPARPEDGLLPAVRDVMQRLALAEAGRSDYASDA